MKFSTIWVFLGIIASLFSCAPYRATLDGPVVAPQGKVSGRYELGMSVPTVSIISIGQNWDIVKEWIKNADEQADTLHIPDSVYIQRASKVMLAFALDPFTPTSDIALAVGVLKGLEVNYRNLGGGHAFGARYQFMNKDLLGTAGFLYSSQDYTLPSWLGKAQELLGYTFERKDYTLPIVFGRRHGSTAFRREWGLGIQAQMSKFQYGFSSDTRLLVADWILTTGTGNDSLAESILAEIPQNEVTGYSLGGFGNYRIGYKFVDISLGLGVYYNKYGTFSLLDDKTLALNGFTFLPKVGIEFRLF